MSAGLAIRPERPEDEAAIAAVIEAAFAGHPHSRGSEARIVAALREAGALELSLVALEDHGVVGHVAFAPVSLAGWRSLGPLAVRPDRQRRGIGTALAKAGLDTLRERDAAGCVLVGDPAFYGRLGFVRHPGLAVTGVPDAYVLALALGDARPGGVVAFHPAFAVP